MPSLSKRLESSTNLVSNYMSRWGTVVDDKQVRSKNIAAVMITCEMPAFVAPGTKMDITVSSNGDFDVAFTPGANFHNAGVSASVTDWWGASASATAYFGDGSGGGCDKPFYFILTRPLVAGVRTDVQ